MDRCIIPYTNAMADKRWLLCLGIIIAIFLYGDVNNITAERLVCVAVLVGSWFAAERTIADTGWMWLFFIVWIIAIFLSWAAFW